jgi:hypothetical protein
MARVWLDYLIAIGWGVAGAVSLACGLGILLKVFDWLTPIDEWEEIRKGNISVAIILAAVILAPGDRDRFCHHACSGRPIVRARLPVPAGYSISP